MKKMLLVLLLSLLPVTFFSSTVTANESSQVMETFNESATGGMVASFDETRQQHEILFIMGVILLLMIFVTAGFGLTMVLTDKKVFVFHMVFAGATVFLSLAHAVAAIVWFFPYR